jgi:hypothetical protein
VKVKMYDLITRGASRKYGKVVTEVFGNVQAYTEWIDADCSSAAYEQSVDVYFADGTHHQEADTSFESFVNSLEIELEVADDTQ